MKRRVPAVRLFQSHRDKPRPSRTGIHWGGAGVDNWRGINHSQNKTELLVHQNQVIKCKMAISQDFQVLIWISKHGVENPQASSIFLSALPAFFSTYLGLIQISKHLKGRFGPRVSDVFCIFCTKGGLSGRPVSDVFCTKGGRLGPGVSDIFCTKGGRSGPCQ